MQENKPLLIIGLGNPGNEYARTRHNAGFMAVDYLAGDNAVWKKEKNALVTKCEIRNKNQNCANDFDSDHISHFILAKPQTFMNLSGTAVLALMNFYKIPISNLVVIHDDMDLPVGKIREKIGGGAAGHNGIKNIDANVGQNYRRIRIGIGHPRDYDSPINPSDWVLGKFTESEIKEIKSVIEQIVL